MPTAMWTPLTREEQRAFLTRKGVVRRATHAFTKKLRHWSYCSTCGLVLLKNEATRKAAKAVCEWEDDA
jgi:hypothetical protein